MTTKPIEQPSALMMSAFARGRNLALRRARLTPRSIVAGGLRWPYYCGGPPEAPALVLVHGFSADKDNWLLYARHFTRRYRVIVPDLPGFGEHDRSLDLDYSIAAQANRLREFLDALGIERPHLAGNSMGGYLILQFAVDYPDRVATLTPIDNGGVGSTSKSQLELAVDAGENPLSVNTLADVRRMFGLVMHRRLVIPRPLVKVLLADIIEHKESNDRIFWALAERGLDGDLDASLPRITAPTLIIWGRQDKIIDVSCVDVMTNLLPNAEAVILEKTGHAPMIERPATTARHHIDFLDRHQHARR